MRNKLFNKGDVICLNYDEYYYSFIFENFRQTNKEDFYYSFVPTTYKQDKIPTIDDLWIEQIPITKTKSGNIGVRFLSIHYKCIELLVGNFVTIGNLKIDDSSEKSGFSRFISIANVQSLVKNIEGILTGLKTELYIYYSE